LHKTFYLSNFIFTPHSAAIPFQRVGFGTTPLEKAVDLHTLRTVTTDPRERGRIVGRRYRPQVRRVGGLYLDHFATLGLEAARVRAIAERSHARLRAWHPGLAAESDACADAAGMDRWVVAAVGARTEVLAAAPPAPEGECSTAVFAPTTGAPETLQTWDWHDALAPVGLLHRLTPARGRTVKLFTEFGVPGKIGVNSSGLGVHFNILSHESDDDSGGVPVHAVARRVLDEADTVEDAVRIAGSARVSASTSLTVLAGARGGRARAVSLELSPAGMAIARAGADGWLLHTNHFLDEGLHTGDTMPADSTTAERFSHLQEIRETMSGRSPADRAKAFCGPAGAQAAVCMRPDPDKPLHEQWGTLLTIGLDTDACALDYLAGDPDLAARNGFAQF